MRICVFGAASALIDKKFVDRTERLCESLAKRGHSLVFGAGATGLMGAAARGFKRGGGMITGVIPKFFREDSVEIIYDGCDELIFTETMAERKQTMERKAEAYIIAPGGIGTFEEFFEVLTLKQLGRHTCAMADYDIDGFYDGLERFMDEVTDKRFVNPTCKSLYSFFADDEKLIDYLENYTPPTTPWHELKNG